MKNDNQGYKRTDKQRANIRQQNVTWAAQRISTAPVVTTSWWTEAKTDAEFSARHAKEVPRMTAQRTSYRMKESEF